jgi:CRISPR/Cas system CMR subunit Cmr6 (Cas7 group RAMP superfamily)
MVNNLKKREDLLNDFTELHKQQINRIESELKIQYENLDNLKDSLSIRIDKNCDIVSRYNSEFNEKIEFLNNKFSNNLSDIDSKWEKTVKELNIAYNKRFKNYNIALSIFSVLVITIILIQIL